MARQRLIAFVPLLVFLAVAVYFLAGLWQAASRGDRYIPDAMVSKPVPAFELASYGDAQPGFSSRELTGRMQLVNFFASWCVPCLAEHPLITDLSRRDDLVVNGIAYSDRPENIEKWLNRHGNPYARVGIDITRRTGIDWGVSGIPETYLVNAEGVIIYKYGGPLNEKIIAQEILPLLEGRGS